MTKRFVAADDLLKDSFQLAADIAASDFRPDFLVGLWRGGSAVAAAAASQSVRRAIGARAVVVWSATRNKLVRSSMAAGWCSWAGAARKSTASKSR